MTLELVYTSVPSGLKRGTYGFCTVACTRNMPALIAASLENLSGYRHIFPAGSPSNPVVYSHLSLSLGGLPAHVLSRISDAGHDYTQRTNKIAHHVVLQDGIDMLPPGGPAGLFAQPDMFLTHWDQEPSYWPNGKKIPAFSEEPAICQNWGKLVGDPGWGGVLAGSVLLRRPACIVYEPGIDLYPLFRESVALLPYPLNWTATFTTFFTKFHPGVKCLWKGVIAGSAEEAQVRAIPNSVLINIAAQPRESEIEKWVCAEPSLVKLIDVARNGLPQIKQTVKTDVSQNYSDTPIQKANFDCVDSIIKPETGNRLIRVPKQRIVLKKKTKNNNARMTLLLGLMSALSILILVGGGLVGYNIYHKRLPAKNSYNTEETGREEQSQSATTPHKIDNTREKSTGGLESNATYILNDLEKNTKEERENLDKEIENPEITRIIKENNGDSINTENRYKELQRRRCQYSTKEEEERFLVESQNRIENSQDKIQKEMDEAEDCYKKQHQQKNITKEIIAEGLQNLKNGQPFISNQAVLDKAENRIADIEDKLKNLREEKNKYLGNVKDKTDELIKEELIEDQLNISKLSPAVEDSSEDGSDWKNLASYRCIEKINIEQINDVCWGFQGYQVNLQPDINIFLNIENYKPAQFHKEYEDGKLSFTGGIQKTDENGNDVSVLRVLLEQEQIVVQVMSSLTDDEINNLDFAVVSFSFKNQNKKTITSSKVPLSRRWAEKLPLVELDSFDENMLSKSIVTYLKEKGVCVDASRFANDVELRIQSLPIKYTHNYKILKYKKTRQGEDKWEWENEDDKTYTFSIALETHNENDYVFKVQPNDSNEDKDFDSCCEEIAENENQKRRQSLTNATTDIDNKIQELQNAKEKVAEDEVSTINEQITELGKQKSKLQKRDNGENQSPENIKSKILKTIGEFTVNLIYENGTYHLIHYRGSKSKK